MAIEVWWGSGSTPAWRALLGFHAKGVPYEDHVVSFSARDTQKPEFLALNPRGKVPVVRDGAFTLNESLAILAWLDRRYPDPPLFGQTPEEHGLVWKWCFEYENHGRIALEEVSRRILFGRHETEGDLLRAGIPGMRAELARLEAAVAGGPLVGDRLSAADLVWYAGVSFSVRAATRPVATAFDLGIFPFAERYPNLLRWGRLVEAIDGFDRTVPPHWLEGESPYPGRWR